MSLSQVSTITTFYLCRYLAAKVHYFGVHGGVRQFEEFLVQSGLFISRVVRVIDASTTHPSITLSLSLSVSPRCETRNSRNHALGLQIKLTCKGSIESSHTKRDLLFGIARRHAHARAKEIDVGPYAFQIDL